MIKLIDHFLFLLDQQETDVNELYSLLDQLYANYPTLPINTCKELLEKKDFASLRTLLEELKIVTMPMQQITNLEGLRTRLKFLELQHAILSQKLASLEQEIMQYQQKHYQELESFISRLLDLKWEILSLKKEKDKAYEADFQQINQERETYKQLHEKKHELATIQLSPEENEVLVKFYRMASKLCHPDLVIDEFKPEAEKWFVELNKAYAAKNIERVKSIYEDLIAKNILFPKITEPISDIELLQANIQRLQQKNEELQQQIDQILTSSIYRNIITHPNLDEYFESLKEHFQKEIYLLEEELKELIDAR